LGQNVVIFVNLDCISKDFFIYQLFSEFKNNYLVIYKIGVSGRQPSFITKKNRSICFLNVFDYLLSKSELKIETSCMCLQGYGMTEAGPVLSMSLGFAKNPFPTSSGSCGTVVRNAELKVLDPDTGRSLGYNQPGEICIRGQQIMKGIYYINAI